MPTPSIRPSRAPSTMFSWVRGEIGVPGSTAGLVTEGLTGEVSEPAGVSRRTISSAKLSPTALAISVARAGSVSVAVTLISTVLVGATALTRAARAVGVVCRSRSSITGSSTPGESTMAV